MIKFPCPHCGVNISAEPEHYGASANCPTCGQELVVPSDQTPACHEELQQSGPISPESNRVISSTTDQVEVKNFDHAKVAHINWIPALVFMCFGSLIAWSISFEYTPFTGGKPRFSELLVALLLFIPRPIFWAILHHKCWAALPERHRATTPAKAIGFLFIPIFNFYWAFVSWPKLSQGLSTWRQELGMPLRSTGGLGITYSILFVCAYSLGLVPGVGILIGIAQLVIFILYYQRVVGSLNEVLKEVVKEVPTKASKKTVFKATAISVAAVLMIGVLIAVFSSKDDQRYYESVDYEEYQRPQVSLPQEKRDIEQTFRRLFPDAVYTDLDRDYSEMAGYVRDMVRGGEALASVYPERRGELKEWQELSSRIFRYNQMKNEK